MVGGQLVQQGRSAMYWRQHARLSHEPVSKQLSTQLMR